MLVNSTNGEFFSRLPAAVSAGVTLGVSLGVDDDERADLLPATSVRAPLRHERNFAMSSHDHGYFAMARDAQTLIGLRRIDVVHLSPGARIKYHGRVGVLLKPPRASDGKSCVRFSRTPEGPSTSSDAAQPPSTTFRDRDLECCLPARAPSPSSVAAPALLALTVPTRICAALVQTANVAPAPYGADPSLHSERTWDEESAEWVTLSVQGLQLDEWCVLREACPSPDSDALLEPDDGCIDVSPGMSAWPASQDTVHKDRKAGKAKKKRARSLTHKATGRGAGKSEGKGKGTRGESSCETRHVDESEQTFRPYTVVTRRLQTGPRVGRPYKRFHYVDNASGTTKVFMSYRAMKQFWQLDGAADAEVRDITTKSTKRKLRTSAGDNEYDAEDETSDSEEETDSQVVNATPGGDLSLHAMDFGGMEEVPTGYTS